MSTPRGFVWVWLAISAAAGGYFLSRPRVQSSDPISSLRLDGLEVEAGDLDFGEVWEEKEIAREVRLRNVTTASITVDDVVPSCGCLTLSPKSLTIPAGGEAAIRISLDLTDRHPSQIGLAVREMSQEISLFRRRTSPTSRTTISVKARVKSRVTLDAVRADFAESLTAGRDGSPLRVRVKVHLHARSVEATTRDPGLVRAELRQLPGEPDTYDVLLHPSPTLPEGYFATELVVKLVETDSGRQVEAAYLPIAGTVLPEVRPLPAKVWLGSKSVGEELETTITLQRADPSVPTPIIERVESDVANIHVERLPDDKSGADPVFHLRVRVEREGNRTDLVRFVIRAPGRAAKTLSTEVSYRGEVLGATPGHGCEPRSKP